MSNKRELGRVSRHFRLAIGVACEAFSRGKGAALVETSREGRSDMVAGDVLGLSYRLGRIAQLCGADRHFPLTAVGCVFDRPRDSLASARTERVANR